MSDSLRSLRGNERMSDSKILFLVCFIYDLKKNLSLIFAHFLFFGEQCERFAHYPSFPLSNVSKSLRSLTKNEQCERTAQVAHQKWATMSDSLTSLRGNERLWANPSGCLPKMSEWVNHSFFWANRSFAYFWAKNEQFPWKTDERIPSHESSPLGNQTSRLEWFSIWFPWI